jgi:alkylation response protein AidB-like acyl-CoA dehydrogenase
LQLAFTPEQNDLRSALREFCRDHGTDTDLRRMVESPEGFDSKVRDRLAAMGVFGLAVPEKFGGEGCGWVDVGVVLEELGRSLLPVPYLSSAVLAVAALLEFGDDDANAAYLPGIANGSLSATLGVTAAAATWDADGVAVDARREGTEWVLDGHTSYVCDGMGADVLLVFARSGDSVGLFGVEPATTGVERNALQVVDRTRPQARVEFSGAPARSIGALDPTWERCSRVLDIAAVALAAESVGGAQRALDMAVEYAKLRKQFGRPIGSFQAIKHLCADMLVRVEAARSAAYYALHAAAVGGPALAPAASLAKAHCGDAFLYAAEQNVLVHGAIGLSWEHSAQLYLKRAKTTDLMFGDSTSHRESLARRIGL